MDTAIYIGVGVVVLGMVGSLVSVGWYMWSGRYEEDQRMQWPFNK